MDTVRFDAIAKVLASRRTRRAALRGAIAAATPVFIASRVAAQEATPESGIQPSEPTDPHPGADAPAKTEYLFVQPFAGGTWAPNETEDGTYTLTLTGAAASTVYFSDRPERIFGLSPTQTFLDGLGFTPANPPNAALVARSAAGDGEDVLVIELFNPVYDGSAATLTYEARLLADYGGEGLREAARRQADYAFPEQFAEGGLFIDDCALLCGHCYVVGENRRAGTIRISTCYQGQVCEPCSTDLGAAEYGQACAQRYPDHCTYDANGGWNCHVAIDDMSRAC